MGQDLDQIIAEYTEVFTQLNKKLKWSIIDPSSLMMISSLYTMNEKSFQMERFSALSNYIKKNVGVFSTLKSSHRFTIAAMIDLHFKEPKENFHKYLDVYEKVVEGGFKRGRFTYIAALSLLTSNAETDSDLLIDRAMIIYKTMKKSHYFLTGDNDYPLAVLLAQLDRNIDVLISDIDRYYDQLHQNGFRKGNDLQFLSHIFTIQQDVDASVLVDRATGLTHDLKKLGLRVKPMFYPAIGLLALIKNSSKDIETIKSLYHRFNTEKQFRWKKDMNFIIATNFIVKDRVENTSLITTGIQTTIETIIQAQQVAMIAGATAAATASSSSN